MAKARAGFHGPMGTGINQLVKGMGGAEYIASLLAGYTGEEKEEFGTVFYENTAYPGRWIAMALHCMVRTWIMMMVIQTI